MLACMNCWAWCPKSKYCTVFLEINNKDIFAIIECFILVWYNLVNIGKFLVHLCDYGLSVYVTRGGLRLWMMN